jgi:hypothetical protein
MEPHEANLPEPTVEYGKVPYIKFGTGKTGIWAGINSFGFGVVGADGNSSLNVVGEYYGGGHLTWEAYEHVVANFTAVKDAYPWLIQFYEDNLIGGSGDIVLIADTSCAMVLEYARPGIWGLNTCRRNSHQDVHQPPYIVRTNFFIILSKYRPAIEDSPVHMSSMNRYSRAMQHLAQSGSTTKIADIENLLRSHLNGKSTFSVCRHGGNGEYNSVGSVIMSVGNGQVNTRYIVNDYPCCNNYKLISLEKSI